MAISVPSSARWAGSVRATADPAAMRRADQAAAAASSRSFSAAPAALGGARGVEHVLRTLLAEADLIMAVDGYPALADLTPDALRRVTAQP